MQDCIKIITKWTDTNMGGVAGIATTVGFVQVCIPIFKTQVVDVSCTLSLKIFSVLISCILMWTKFDTKS